MQAQDTLQDPGVDLRIVNRRAKWRSAVAIDQCTHADFIGRVVDVKMNHWRRILQRQVDDISSSARPPCRLAVPDCDQDIGRLNERLPDKQIGALDVRSSTREGDNLVRRFQCLLEHFELIAIGEIHPIIAGLEWQKCANEISARSSANRRDLVCTRRQRGMKIQLCGSRATIAICWILCPQGRFAQLTKDDINDRPKRSNERRRQNGGAVAGDGYVESERSRSAGIGHGLDPAALGRCRETPHLSASGSAAVAERMALNRMGHRDLADT